MTSGSMKLLAALVTMLLVAVLVLEFSDRSAPRRTDDRLLPQFEAHVAGIVKVSVTTPDTGTVTLQRDDGQWTVTERDGYPADLDTLRELISALARARIVEEKTSNPALYDRLGVNAPDAGGNGTQIELSGADVSRVVILGDVARRTLRYARVDDDPTSYLISANPRVPSSPSDWLDTKLIDIAADDVRRVQIAHADGETVIVEKSSPEQSDVTVVGVPEGRELSYPTVANGIVGALSSVELDDVRPGGEFVPVTTTTFETWDGRSVQVTSFADGDERWFEFSAAASDDQGRDDADRSDGNGGSTARLIADRLSGWHYRLPDYKANLLTRRWSDLLSDEDSAR